MYGATQQGFELSSKFKSLNDMSDKMFQNAGTLNLLKNIVAGGKLDYSFSLSIEASKEASLQLIESKYLEAKFIDSETNYFFAQGENIAN